MKKEAKPGRAETLAFLSRESEKGIGQHTLPETVTHLI